MSGGIDMADKRKRLAEFVVDVERDQRKRKSGGSSLGIEVSGSPVKVTKLNSSSCFLGKLFVGDVIISMNDQKIENPADFMKIARSETKMKIKLMRDEFCSCKVVPVPSTKDGVEYFDFELSWRVGGMPIGILVYEDDKKRVIVSVVSSGTLAYENIKPGDVVIKVNAVLVPNKATAKKLIFESVSTKQRVTLTVERSTGSGASSAPASSSTVAASTTSATPAKSPISPGPATAVITGVCPVPPASAKSLNFDLPLPPDVLAIMENNRNFFEQLNTNPSILKRSSALPASSSYMDSSSSVSTDGENTPTKSASRTTLPTGNVMHEETKIEYDSDGKPLQVTPKRLGS